MNKRFTLRILSALALLLIANNRVAAEPSSSTPTLLRAIQVALPPVPDRGTPGKRGEGASRGDCIRGAQPFTAIVPAIASKTTTNQTLTNVWGLTTAERPTLFAYVPFAPKCSTLEFTVQDRAGQVVYRLPVAVPQKAGLVRIQVPPTAPALELNALYRWSLQAAVTPKAIGLEETRPKPDLYRVNGWIQRVSLPPSLSQQFNPANPRQQARLYAERGIWFDAVAMIAESRLANPQDPELAKDWAQLLQAVNLETFATESIEATTSAASKIQPPRSR